MAVYVFFSPPYPSPEPADRAVRYWEANREACNQSAMFNDTPGQMISLPIFLYFFGGLAIGLSLLILVLRSQLKKTP
ncbi:hypothetical protein [Gloeobacter kilaueensis]|nr:hypothetical protein [Gloeobacter kilaueensis]